MSNQKNIMFLGPYPPPYGGIASHLRTFIPFLHTKGITNTIVVNFGEQDKKEIVENIIIYRYNPKRHFLLLINPCNFHLIFKIILSLSTESINFIQIIQESIKGVIINQLVKKHNINIISTYMVHANVSIYPLNQLWKSKINIYMTVLGDIFEAETFIQKNRKLISNILKISTKVLSSSKHCADSFSKYGFQIPIETIYYGVDLNNKKDEKKRIEFREKNNIPNNGIVVLFMGRFVKDMGLDVILDSIDELLLIKDLYIVLSGAKGELSTRAKNESNKYSDRIFLLENITYEIQKDLYSASDILIAPSFNQRACMGVSIKEAMAASLPVIASDGGGVPEAVLDNETGFLVPLDINGKTNQTLLIKKIQELAENNILRKKFGNSGRLRAENIFSVDETNYKMLKILLND